MKAREWSPQKRRIVVLCGALLIGFGLLWFYFVATEKPPAPPKKPDSSGSLSDGQTKSILAPGAQVDPREAWMATAGKEVSKIGDRVGKMEDTQQQVMQTQKRIESELLPKLTEAIEKSKAEAAASAATNVVPPAPRASALSGVTPVNPRGFPPDNALSAPPRGTVPIRQPGQLGAGDYQSGIEDSPALAAGQPRAMLRLSSLREEASAIPGNTAGISPPAAPAAATSPAKKPRTVENYLPVSFTPAILLGG
ncbi:MAG: hypothetical protein JNM52_09365, partial [Betaproteobacteria bacterium]|nr:hypothetical protein [Betaproteobacteria bacterium]